MPLVSSNFYFEHYRKTRKSYGFFFEMFQKNKVVGRYLRVTLSIEKIPFKFAVYLKSGFFKYFVLFLDYYTIDGVCVAKTLRNFGSRFILRQIDAGVIYERALSFFSPVIINIQYRPVFRSGLRYKTRHKAKLYYVKHTVQKKMLLYLFK